jgi:hypothetical protein
MPSLNRPGKPVAFEGEVLFDTCEMTQESKLRICFRGQTPMAAHRSADWTSARPPTTFARESELIAYCYWKQVAFMLAPPKSDTVPNCPDQLVYGV